MHYDKVLSYSADHLRIMNPTVISSATVWASLDIILKALGLYIKYNRS